MSRIGEWVARDNGDVIYGVAHLVESEIADRVVVKCGRELANRDSHGSLFVVSIGDETPHCKQCNGRAT